MAGLWSVILPSDTDITNLVTNPSIETSTTGYVAIAGSIAASYTYARRGARSLAVTPAATSTDGAYYDAVTLTSGTAYTAAFDFRGVAGVPYVAHFADTAAAVAGTPLTWTATGEWERKAVTYSSTASAAFRLYWTKGGNASVAPFYLDGVGVYAYSYDPGHVDGDQEDCAWIGIAHAATSFRKYGSRSGGQTVNLDTYQFYLSEYPGVGMEELSVMTAPFPLLPGSRDTGTKSVERQFSLVGTITGSSLPNLHANRKALINALRQDAVRNEQPVTLIYSGANPSRPTRIRARYKGGLSLAKPEGFTEQLALQFVASDPYFYEDGTEGASITTSQALSDAYAVRRVSGVWQGTGVTFNNRVQSIAVAPDGPVYFGGAFTDAGSTNGDYVVKFASASSTSVSALGSGCAGGAVNALLVAPNLDLYAGGAFTSAGGVANTARVARWDSTGWNAVAGGLANGAVNALAWGADGRLYAGGSFTAAGGSTNGNYIAAYDGATWNELATGLDGEVKAIAIDPGGTVYAAGAFTGRLAAWNGTSWQVLGGGLDAAGVALCALRDGTVLVSSDYIAADACYGLYAWSGGGLSRQPISGLIRSMWQNPDTGMVYMVGDNSFHGPVSSSDGPYYGPPRPIHYTNLAAWMDGELAELPVSSTDYAGAVSGRGDDLFLGTTPNATAALNVVTNTGTAISYPQITVKLTSGAASVAYFRNVTTGATLWLSYPLSVGETLVIDTHPRRRSVVSSMHGNVIGRALLRMSEFAAFHLLPGQNEISAYVETAGTTTVTASMVWAVTHHSVDGSAV